MRQLHYLKHKPCKSRRLMLQRELPPSTSETLRVVHINTQNFLSVRTAQPSDPPEILYFSHGSGTDKKKEERSTYQANFCLSTQTQTLGGP